MNEKVECLVLKHTDYQENSLLVSVLTKKYGKLSFIVRGGKKSTSKNASNIIPYTKSNFLFDYHENSTIFSLRKAETLDYYKTMHNDLSLVTSATLVSEAIDHLLFDELDFYAIEETYDLLDKTFELLNTSNDAIIVTSLFLCNLLKIIGLGMNVDECVLCGKKKIRSFSVREGGFVCEECASKNNIPFQDKTTLQMIRLLNKANMNQYDALVPYIQKENIPLEDIVRFYELHVGTKLRSYAFFKQVLPLNQDH